MRKKGKFVTTQRLEESHVFDITQFHLGETKVVIVTVLGACFDSSGRVIPGAAHFVQRLHSAGATIFYVLDGYGGDLAVTYTCQLRENGFPTPGSRHARLFMANKPSEQYRYFFGKLLGYASPIGSLEAIFGGKGSGFFEWVDKNTFFRKEGYEVFNVKDWYEPDPLTESERVNMVRLQDALLCWWRMKPEHGGPLKSDMGKTARAIEGLLSSPTIVVHDRRRHMLIDPVMNSNLEAPLAIRFIEAVRGEGLEVNAIMTRPYGDRPRNQMGIQLEN